MPKAKSLEESVAEAPVGTPASSVSNSLSRDSLAKASDSFVKASVAFLVEKPQL